MSHVGIMTTLISPILATGFVTPAMMLIFPRASLTSCRHIIAIHTRFDARDISSWPARI
jgi:hypothetical protein